MEAPLFADQTSGDRPVDVTNGPSGGQQHRLISAPDTPQYQQTLADVEQTLSDAEQTLAETEQALSDAGQISSDCDQAAADGDQVAADIDQADCDRVRTDGADRSAHSTARDVRQRSARQREHAAQARLDSAARRDESLMPAISSRSHAHNLPPNINCRSQATTVPTSRTTYRRDHERRKPARNPHSDREIAIWLAKCSGQDHKLVHRRPERILVPANRLAPAAQTSAKTRSAAATAATA